VQAERPARQWQIRLRFARRVGSREHRRRQSGDADKAEGEKTEATSVRMRCT
jgi:hypothetical protein